MSLGLFAAIVIKLQAECSRVVPVAELAAWVAIPDEQVRAALLDIYTQGHCTLSLDDARHISGAQWVAEAACN